MITFVVVGVIGLVLVLASMLLGEFLDFGDGTLSGTALGVGAIVFGAVGAIVLSTSLPVAVAYVGSLVIAIIVIAAMQRIVKHLRDTEDGVPESVVGAQGIATADISESRGEVSIDTARDLERRLAWSDEPIPEGARVVVLEQSGSRVRVQRFYPND